MGRVSSGAKVAAALVGCLSLPATAFLVVAIGRLQDAGDGGGGRARSDVDALDPLAAAIDVYKHLQAEGARYGIELVGADEAVDLPQGADAGSPQRTDEAVDDLRTKLEGQGADAAADYITLFDAVATLDDIRADIATNQATPDFGTLSNVEAAQDVRDRYREVGHTVRNAIQGALIAIDDPDLRTSVEVGLAAASQQALLGDMTSSLLLAAVSGGLNTPDDITTVAAALGEWQAADATLRAAGPPYDAMVDQHVPVRLVDDVTTVVEQALSTGTVDMRTLLDTLAEPDAQGLNDLEDAAAEQRDQLAARSEADPGSGDEARALFVVGLAALTVLAPLVVAIVVLVVAGGRAPTPVPPGMAPPEPFP